MGVWDRSLIAAPASGSGRSPAEGQNLKGVEAGKETADAGLPVLDASKPR